MSYPHVCFVKTEKALFAVLKITFYVTHNRLLHYDLDSKRVIALCYVLSIGNRSI